MFCFVLGFFLTHRRTSTSGPGLFCVGQNLSALMAQIYQADTNLKQFCQKKTCNLALLIVNICSNML